MIGRADLAMRIDQEIGAALGELERALLPRNVTFLLKVGLLRLRRAPG